MSRVILKGFIVVPEAELSLIIQELAVHRYLPQKEVGCLVFEVTQSAENPSHFDVYEEFIDNAAFNKHQERVKNSRWGEVTGNVERQYSVRS